MNTAKHPAKVPTLPKTAKHTITPGGYYLHHDGTNVRQVADVADEITLWADQVGPSCCQTEAFASICPHVLYDPNHPISSLHGVNFAIGLLEHQMDEITEQLSAESLQNLDTTSTQARCERTMEMLQALLSHRAHIQVELAPSKPIPAGMQMIWGIMTKHGKARLLSNSDGQLLVHYMRFESEGPTMVLSEDHLVPIEDIELSPALANSGTLVDSLKRLLQANSALPIKATA